MSEESSILDNVVPEANEDICAVKKRRVVWLLLVYAAILGLIGGFLPQEETPADFIIGLPLLILGVWWCLLDAAERGERIGNLLRWMLVLFFFAAFPFYVFRTRGMRGFVTLGYVLLLIGGMGICMLSTMLLMMFLGQQLGWWDWGA